MIFIRGSCFGTPCVPCAGLTGTVIRDDYENRGAELGGGGGADTRREGLKEHSV